MTTFNWHQPQRQPPKALVYVFYKTLLSLIKSLGPFLLLLLFRKSSKAGISWEYIAIIFPVATLIISFIQYRMLTFFIENKQQLIIQKGLFTRQQIILPTEKIQSVNINQQWLHRLINLAEVSFDSPGSNEEEAKLTLTIQQARELKEEILLDKQSNVTDDERSIATQQQSHLLYKLNSNALLKLGLTANHIETFFITLAFGFTIIGNINDISKEFLKKGINKISAHFLHQSLVAIFILILAFIILSIFISFVRIILKYANFQITTIQSKFSIDTGLINTKEVLIPFSKIQFISWQANWLRTKTNMYLLKFCSIGEGNLKEKQRVAVPLTNLKYLPEILSVYHPTIANTHLQSIHISPKFFRRILLLFIAPIFLIVIAAGFYNYLFWFLLVVVFYHAVGYYLLQRNFRLYINDDALQISKGRYGKQEILVLWNKIQSVELKQSIYQRKNKLASVALHTAGGSVNIPYISLNTANKLTDYALYKMETENWR